MRRERDLKVSGPRTIEIVGGVLLVAVGVGDLVVNLDNLRLTFGL